MGVRETFYDDLRRDFEDNWKDSFLFRYLKEERLTRTGGEKVRLDVWDQLEDSYARYELGKLDGQSYLEEALALSRRFRLGMSGELRSLLEREKTTESKLNAIHGRLLDSAVRRDAQTFLYDAGRKKDRNLALLDAYCESRGLTLNGGGSGGALTAAEQEQWERLFALLRKGKRRRCLLPIRVDPLTGAGLYIVGSAYYPEEMIWPEKLPQACYYACFYLDEAAAEGDISLLFRSFQEELEAMCALPDLTEAERWYRAMLQEDGRGFYRCNGPAPAGCPEELKRYFQSDRPQKPDRAAVIREGAAAFEKETPKEQEDKRDG